MIRFSIIFFILMLLVSCAAGINSNPGTTANEVVEFNADMEGVGSTTTMTSEKYQMTVKFPLSFPASVSVSEKHSMEVQ